MTACAIDHITVTAPTLQSGADYVAQCLGVELQTGGEHPRMGTHNLLLRLGEAMFLEVIAVNPAAPAPAQPRWFELDELAAGDAPRLATWVARTGDIRETVRSLPGDTGPIETMTRGQLEWLITIPRDGRMPLGGLGPALIQWPPSTHPAKALRDTGCSLAALEAQHEDAGAVAAWLAAIGLEDSVTVNRLPAGGRPRLVAQINTPHGLRRLG